MAVAAERASSSTPTLEMWRCQGRRKDGRKCGWPQVEVSSDCGHYHRKRCSKCGHWNEGYPFPREQPEPGTL
jgi:hypothetical protein